MRGALTHGSTGGYRAGVDPERRSRVLALTTDICLVLAVVLAGLIRDAERISPTPGHGVSGYLFGLPAGALVTVHVASAAVLMWRRHHAVIVASTLVAMAVLAPTLAAVVMPYSVARYARNLRHGIPLCVLLVAAVLTGADLWGEFDTWSGGTGDPYTPILAMAALTAAGLYLRARSDLITQVRARAEAAARESVLVAQHERLRDRATVAGNLHDVGARWVTLMTMQAGALSVQATDPQVRAEAEQMRQKGERALTELHRLIRVLTGDEEEDLADEAPDESRSLESLVSDFAHGVGAELHELGDPVNAPGRHQALVRQVVVESLVNAVKHAPGGSVRLQVEWASDRAQVQILSRTPTDDGPRPAAATVGSALGLRSLAQRCTHLGGTLQVRPDGVRGAFEVRADLPYRKAP